MSPNPVPSPVARRLKVAVLADTLPPAGFSGVGNSHLGLYQALKAAGFSVRAYTWLDRQGPAGDDPAIHRRRLPALLLGAGTALLSLGIFSRLHVVPGWGTALVVAGGVLLVGGHLLNLRPVDGP